ncbi:MAG: ComEA family DNA-binding protein [Christensenellales bacterium]|jgi:DNA uptake protein ComE-like DNA-binding protein
MRRRPSRHKLWHALGISALLACLAILVALAVPAFRDFLARGSPQALTLRPEAAQAPKPSFQPSQGLLNLNTATKEQLMSLPGIGEQLAERIIRQRALHPFHFVEDLRVVSGFGDKRIAALRELVYVEGPGSRDTDTPTD